MKASFGALLTSMVILAGCVGPGRLPFESPKVVEYLDGNYRVLASCTQQQLSRQHGQLRMTDLRERRTVTISPPEPQSQPHISERMHSTRTAVLAMLVALLLPAAALLAETAPPDRSKTAGPISAELAKKCRALAIKAQPTKPVGSKNGAYAQAQRDYFQDCIAKGGNMPDEPHTTGDSR
jgi:hypothetical protein